MTLRETIGLSENIYSREKSYHEIMMKGGHLGVMQGNLDHIGKSHVTIEVLELPVGDPEKGVTHLYSAARLSQRARKSRLNLQGPVTRI